jgi:endonuclease YncB( thermonuclease family)
MAPAGPPLVKEKHAAAPEVAAARTRVNRFAACGIATGPVIGSALMRKFVPFLALAGLLAAGAALSFRQPAPPTAAVTIALRPAAPMTANAAEAPAAPAPQAPAAAPADAPPPAAAPPPKPLPELPTREVAQPVVHTIHEDGPPPRGSQTAAAPSIPPRLPPHPAPQTAVVARPPPPPPPLPAGPLDGKARIAGATLILVDGRPVKLYGVRPPDADDRCRADDAGGARPCDDLARALLAQRLGDRPEVHCRVPAKQKGEQGAVCRDAGGVDLGGLLVGEGLALADRRQAADYAEAEAAARASKRGLWRYR